MSEDSNKEAITEKVVSNEKKEEVKPEVTVSDLKKLKEYTDKRFEEFLKQMPKSKPKKEAPTPQLEPQVPTIQKTEKPKETPNIKNIVNGIYIG